MTWPQMTNHNTEIEEIWTYKETYIQRKDSNVTRMDSNESEVNENSNNWNNQQIQRICINTWINAKKMQIAKWNKKGNMR
jgi:hypothetical protein